MRFLSKTPARVHRSRRPLAPLLPAGADEAGLEPCARDEARLRAYHGHNYHAFQRRCAQHDTSAAPSCME
jgi:hypothetical protein